MWWVGQWKGENMKNLILLNNDTNIKLGDTGTLMQFKADDNNAPVSLIKGQSATFRIKNEFGFLKSIDADTTMSGYVFQFDTSALDGLVPGTYQLELAVTKSDDDVDIFPDTGFVQFTINENALSITGEQLPVMSLDDFKKQAQAYVDTQINGAETSLENNFQKYVDGIQNNAVNVAKQASTNATQAVTTAQAASTMANGASTMANQALGLINSKTKLEDYAKNNNLTDLNNLPIGMYQTNGWGADHNLTNYPPIQDFGTIWVLQRWIANDRQQIAVYPNKIYIRFQSPNNHTWSDWSLVGGVNDAFVNINNSTNLAPNSEYVTRSVGCNPYDSWTQIDEWYYTQDNNTNSFTRNLWYGYSAGRVYLYEGNDLVSSGVQVGDAQKNNVYSASILYCNAAIQGATVTVSLEYATNNLFQDSQLVTIGVITEESDAGWAKLKLENIQVPQNYNWLRFHISSTGTTPQNTSYHWFAQPMLVYGDKLPSDYISSNQPGQRIGSVESNVAAMQQQLTMLTTKIAQLETNKS